MTEEQARIAALEAELEQERRRGADLAQRAEALEEALRRAEDNLEQYAYLVSHDLQEPLRMVVGFSQLLQRRCGEGMPEQAREYLELTAGSAQRMSQMLADLLTLSRVGRAPVGREPADLEAVFAKARGRLAPVIEQSGAELSVQPLPTVAGDAALLAQVFQCLLDNALKYRGEAPPRIDVGARRQGQAWEIAVGDQGIGLEPKFAERIFQPFQRLHTQNEYPGTGMGLTIARRIVERHGGRMWVESKPGEGAIFRFTLPACEAAAR